MAENTVGTVEPRKLYDDRDMLKAVVQERKMARAAAGKRDEMRDRVAENNWRMTHPYSSWSSTPTLPAPVGFMPTAPSYWQNPLNVVYAMSQVMANPGQYAWTDLAKSTFSYLSQLPQNYGLEPEQWTWAGENDPLMLQLGSYEPPPLEYQNPNIGGSATEALYSAIYPIQRTPSAVTQAQTANVALPEWQQWYEGFTSNPYAQAALQALPVFVFSTLAGTADRVGRGGLVADDIPVRRQYHGRLCVGGVFAQGIGYIKVNQESASRRLLALRKTEEERVGTYFPPAHSYLLEKTRRLIAGSPLLEVMKRLPKGGILHVHGSAGGDLRWLLSQAVARPDCYMFVGSKAPVVRGALRFFPAPPEGAWRQLQALRSEAADARAFDEELLRSVTLGEEDQAAPDIWAEFGNW